MGLKQRVKRVAEYDLSMKSRRSSRPASPVSSQAHSRKLQFPAQHNLGFVPEEEAAAAAGGLDVVDEYQEYELVDEEEKCEEGKQEEAYCAPTAPPAM